MDSLSIALRLLTIFIFIEWQMYWWITEKKADREKPKTSHKTNYFERCGLYVVLLLLLLQLLGVKILFTPLPVSAQIVGFILVLIGIGICVVARINLGANWAHADSYQIKEKQTLTSHGVYHYIRHPIYSGFMFAITGACIVAQFPLFLLVFLAMLFVGYRAGKREETLLERHFGKKYAQYKKKTKMLIPFIW